MKQLYIRQSIKDPKVIIVGDESEIGGRDKAYTHKGSADGEEYLRVTDDIELGKHGYNRDHQVHKFIREHCYDLVTYVSDKTKYNTREAFECIGDPETCINDLYRRIKEEVEQNKEATRWEVKPGPQDEATTAIFDFFQSENKEFLLNAFCRMGKTFAVLYTFTEGSDYKNAMFISGKSDAVRECYQTPYKCSNFDDIAVLDFEEYDELKADNSLPDRWIIADTCQMIQRRAKAGEEIPNVGVIFFDECHFYNTDYVADLIKDKYEKIVYMSATPEQLLATGDFTVAKKNIYEFTLTDLYKSLQNETLSSHDYILPRMYIPSMEAYIKNLQADNSIKDITKQYFNDCMNDNGFSFSSFFELTPAKKPTFVHVAEVKLFAEALVNFLNEAGNKIDYETELNNFMIFMPQRKEVSEEFAKMLRKYLSAKDNVFVMVADNKDEGGNGSSNDVRLSQIKSSMKKNEGLTIVLSYQKLGTGCTIEDLQSVMFLNDSENACRILQNLSRCLTTNGEKKYGVIFEMNQARAIVDRFKIITSKYGQFLPEEEAEKIFGETVNLMPINKIIELGTLEEVPLKYEDAFMCYNKLNGACNVFEMSKVSDMRQLLDLIKGVDAFSGTTTSMHDAEAEIRKAVKVITTVRHRGQSLAEKTTKITDQLVKERLLTLSNYLKTTWWLSNATSIEEYMDFYKDEANTETFKNATSISFNDFSQYIFPILNSTLFTSICKSFNLNAEQKDLKFADTSVYTSAELFS